MLSVSSTNSQSFASENLLSFFHLINFSSSFLEHERPFIDFNEETVTGLVRILDMIVFSHPEAKPRGTLRMTMIGIKVPTTTYAPLPR